MTYARDDADSRSPVGSESLPETLRYWQTDERSRAFSKKLEKEAAQLAEGAKQDKTIER